MLLKPLGHLSVDAPYSPTLLFRSKPALLKRVFQGYRFFVVRTGFEPVLLVITLFTNHPYLGPSTIPTPDYFVIPTGFEPVTYCLEGSCSIQLSYEVFPYRRCKNTTNFWEFIHLWNICMTHHFYGKFHRKEKINSFFLLILHQTKFVGGLLFTNVSNL